MGVRTANAVEADLAALRAAADRAGTALACIFSCSDEFEAEIIRKRRAEGAYDRIDDASHPMRRIVPITLLALIFFFI